MARPRRHPRRRDRPWPLVAGTTLLAVGLLLLIGWSFASRKNTESGAGPAVVQPKTTDPAPPKSPDSARPHVESGLAWLRKDEHEKAIAEFDQAIRLDPSSAVAFAGRGYSHALSFRPRNSATAPMLRKAREDSDEALRLDPDLPFGIAVRGITLSMRGESTKALEDCEKAIHLKPDDALLYLIKAQVLFRRGMREDTEGDRKAATKTSSRAIALDPKLVAAYSFRGNARLRAEEHDRAMEDFEMAHQLDPDNPLGFINKGKVFQAKEELDRAIHQFSLAIEKDPNSLQAFGLRAGVYEAKGDHARAEADRQTVKRLQSRQPAP